MSRGLLTSFLFACLLSVAAAVDGTASFQVTATQVSTRKPVARPQQPHSPLSRRLFLPPPTRSQPLPLSHRLAPSPPKTAHHPTTNTTESIALENTEDNRRAYRELLVTTPGLGKYISGAIMFEETLFQSTSTGKKMTDCLKEQNIVPGIKVCV